MLLLQCCIVVQVVATCTAAYYHVLSMETFRPPFALANDSYFGYSVAYNQQNQSLVISAPRADANGLLFSCGVSTQSCMQLNVMSASDIRRVGAEKYKHYNHHFWLGATVKADSKNLVVCAPRDYMKSSEFNFFGTYGRCYWKDLSSTSDSFQMLSLMSHSDRGGPYHLMYQHGTDTLGWSVDIAENHNIRVGGPAMTAGRVITYEKPSPHKLPKVLNGINTPEKVQFNFGYSIATGSFFGGQYIAVSTPYGHKGEGKVLFFDKNNNYRWTIYDHAVGSLFGASLCSAKLTDTKSSLLIGAPAFFEDRHHYHRGIVYLYVPTEKPSLKMELKNTINGPKDGGFFGYSIANVGDMDADGKDEIVIAAPYEDDGRGAVYLFAGSALVRDLTISHIQRFQPQGFTSFGLSLSAVTYSNNGCKDLAIGAPESDKVALYYCLPAITVHVEAVFPNLQSRTDKTRFGLKSCLRIKYPNHDRPIEADFQVTIRLTHPNATFSDKSQHWIYRQSLHRPDTYPCQNIIVLTNENGDYEQDIQFEITAVLINDPIGREEFRSSFVTVSNHSSLSLTESVRAADCQTEHCEPNLSLDVQATIASDRYLIGSTDSESLRVIIKNGEGDTAYRPCARISVAGGATIARAPPSCVSFNTSTRVCQLQGPLVNQSFWDITRDTSIEIDMTSLTSSSPSMRITVAVFNRCNMSDVAAVTKEIPVAFKNDTSGIKIEGKTDEGDDNTVIATRAEINDIGKKLHHTYTITNIHGTNWIDPTCWVWIKKEPYFNIVYPIKVYNADSRGAPCQPVATSNRDFELLKCDIERLFKKETITIIVPIYSQPGKLGKILEKSNATIQTNITLHFDDEYEDIGKSLTTTLTLHETAVPLWIILAAAVVGLLIVVLIAFVLYECGFLRRKNKEKLEDLKTEVKRKSMILHRQSMRMSQGSRATLRNRTYRELLDDAEILEIEEAIEARESQLIRDSVLPNVQEAPLDADIKKQIELSLKRQAADKKDRYNPQDRAI